jgi:hypothetical protein
MLKLFLQYGGVQATTGCGNVESRRRLINPEMWMHATATLHITCPPYSFLSSFFLITDIQPSVAKPRCVAESQSSHRILFNWAATIIMVQLPRQLRTLFQDSIVVNIPLDVVADLGIAVARTREKRIKAILENFPSLKKEVSQEDKEELDSEDDDEGNKDKVNAKVGEAKERKQRTNPHAPQRNQYGNIIDYLEAKYVRGVMLQDEDDADDDEDDEDEKRSVYDSESSFLDDSLLRRDVAEQVLSQATHTKLELEQDEDAFFVNVGALEVEDNDLMEYDALEDDEKSIKKTSKRKRPTSLDSSKTAASKKSKTSVKKPVAAPEKSQSKDNQSTKAANSKTAQTASGDEPTTKRDVNVTPAMQEQIDALKSRAADLKQRSDKIFEDTCAAIKRMTDKELPRKKKNEKVSIVVPDGKSPGDDITFANPHVPGQKLRVKVPKNSVPGSKFVVSVPVPTKANPDVDNNKWSREAQDLLDDFSHIYDDWCHAEAAWREVDPTVAKKFQLHHERMNKFDKILAVFPKDLVTPIDGTYLRKVVRRARQNKHKRIKTALKFEEDGVTPIPQPSSPASLKPDVESAKPVLKIAVPGKGQRFPFVPAPLEL